MPKKKTTIENLAIMIKRGFDETAKKKEVDKRFGFVYRDEFEDALARISLIERKLGLESRK